MKKTLTLLLAASLFSINALAQISFKYRTVEKVYFDKENFDYAVNNEIINGTTDATDTVFTWTRIEDIPSGWETAVCEDELCYPTSKATNDINLGAGKSMKFKLNFYPWSIRDCGAGKIVIVSKKNSSNRDTFDTEVCSFDPASVKELNKVFSVYPNPANDFVTVNTTLNGVLTVKIYDILGSLKLTTNVMNGERINVSGLNRGAYILKIDGNSEATQIIQKL
ncbi:MAG: hypothetical protein RLZZ337_242 [Bacteroidota bacterium]|jgi:hypothetical protein